MKSFAVDRQSKDLGSNPSTVKGVSFSTERFQNSLNLNLICIYLRYVEIV